jgi:D-beta-D-heptose 7-phosphate kinase/D-beta-D-heptose 1-phosphate adenosyltransferase
MTSFPKIVMINGCYDILHPGHIQLIKYAASLGNFLVAALDTDERVRANKSLDRPINCLSDRMFMISSIKGVDAVESFDSEKELRVLMKLYRPDYLVIGEEYKDKYIIGEDLVKEVKFFRRIDGYSTTNTIKSITNR